MFMSEPSVTTDGDRTGDSNNLSFLLSQLDSSEDESVEEAAISSPPPPSAQQLASISSPGNTSLSSRESPHFQNKIQMQFMNDQASRLKIDSTPYAPALHMIRQTPTRPEVSTKPYELGNRNEQASVPSSRSTSSISVGQQQRATEFLQDLKIQSVGALQDAGLSDHDSIPMAATDRSEIDTVIRRHETRPEVTGDDTIVMTLSDSEGEKGDDLDSLDWEQQVSADDEQTFERPKRVRRPIANTGKNSPAHRRSRSGDNAAATFVNGGIDWKGMHEGGLRIPPSLDDNENDDDDDDDKDEDDEHDVDEAISPRRKSSSGGVLPGAKNNLTLSKEAVSEASPLFSIGSLGTGAGGNSTRKAKKPPRLRTWRSERFDPQYGSAARMRQPGTPPGPSLRRAHSLAGPGMAHPSNFYQRPGDSQGPVLRTMMLAGPYQETISSTDGVASNGFMRHNSLHANNASHGSLQRMPLDSITDLSRSLPQFVDGQDSGWRFYRRFSDSSCSNDAIHSTGSMHSWISEGGSRPKPLHLQSEFGSMEEMWGQSNDGRRIVEGQEDGSYAQDTVDGDSSSSASAVEGDDPCNKRQIHVDQMRSSFRDADRIFPAEEIGENNPYRYIEQHAGRLRPSLPRKRHDMKKVEFKSTTGSDRDPKQFPTFTCPKCGTVQRSFFTASTAPTQFEGPASYLALYFAFYVVASLYIFGLEEGWKGLDCVYFAVITLTTAGLGDLVPTSDSAKIVCSIFIYFGVACIGLLLGTYLAGMLDESSYKEAMKSRADNCVECSRVKGSLKRELKRSVVTPTNRRAALADKSSPNFSSERFTRATDAQQQVSQSFKDQSQKRTKRWHDTGSIDSEFASGARSFSPHVGPAQQRSGFTPPSPIPEMNVLDDFAGETPSPISPATEFDSFSVGSPMTKQILGRQRHTRHQSFDIPNSGYFATPGTAGKTRDRNNGINAAVLEEPVSFHESFVKPSTPLWSDDPEDIQHMFRDEESTTSVDSVIGALDSSESRIKTAKYVFLTLKQALMNSIAIIFIGGIGFYYIEKMTMVDSFYFTTVLLTTVGYGDIAPVTDGGKLFATVYVLVAGTVLLNNMSLISMIPLELRRRRIEKAVLTQFGDQLDDAALEELATGPLIHRLNLSAHNSNGLNECTREMFALAMLVRLGKVTERDVRHTFAAFRRLDVDREGVLNSKTIISGKIKKVRSMRDVREGLAQSRSGCNSPQPLPSPDHANSSNPRKFWFGPKGSLHVEEGSGAFRFPDLRHASSMEETSGEQTALLGQNVNALPFAGGTFSSHDEENGVLV
jgi:DNA-directed RNA polymerase subunit M/transcription elongation factor TFIIS